MKRKILAGAYLILILICCIVFCRYIFLYNAGNKHFRTSDYTKAIQTYEKALDANPSRRQECNIRINLALAMIYNLGNDYQQPDRIDSTIQTLKQAREVLLADGCATEDGDGHNATSEKLKVEIDKMIEELENQSQTASHSDVDQEQETDTPEEDLAEQNIKEQLQQIQENAYKERQDGLGFTEELQTDYNFDMETPIW